MGCAKFITLGMLAVSLCGLPLHALAQEDEDPGVEQFDASAPRLFSPKFPLEPGKKPEQPIRPETYVAGAAAPPVAATAADDLPMARKGRGTRWQNSLQLGWFMANQSAKHQFSASTFADVRRTNSNALSLSGRLDLRPPSILSAVIAVETSMGRADVKVDRSAVPLTRIDVQDIRARAGARVRFTRAASDHALLAGADGAADFVSYTTLDSALAAIAVDSRRIFAVIPRLVYRYSPPSNWSVEVIGGYSLPVSSAGSGDVKASDYRRIEAAARAIRYLDPSNALGFGAFFADEKATWTRSAPSTLSDLVATQDLRVHVFWTHDF
jgi:hypothetical protein